MFDPVNNMFILGKEGYILSDTSCVNILSWKGNVSNRMCFIPVMAGTTFKHLFASRNKNSWFALLSLHF